MNTLNFIGRLVTRRLVYLAAALLLFLSWSTVRQEWSWQKYFAVNRDAVIEIDFIGPTRNGNDTRIEITDTEKINEILDIYEAFPHTGYDVTPSKNQLIGTSDYFIVFISAVDRKKLALSAYSVAIEHERGYGSDEPYFQPLIDLLEAHPAS